MSQTRKGHWPSNLFAPTEDFYNLLLQHVYKALEGVEVLSDWFQDPVEAKAQRVRELEKEADELKLHLQHQLVESFITPFDREDIFDLSMRVDEIINAAKAVVREAEAMEISVSGPHLKAMAQVLAEGTRCLSHSFESLKTNALEATNQARLARKSENRFSKIYRQAMRELFTSDDFKTVLKTKEVYRYLLAAADRIDSVGEKLLFVIIKMN